MAKSGKPRHSASTRKAPVIDHQPLETKAMNPEPIAMGQKTMNETEPKTTSSHEGSSSATMKSKPEQTTISAKPVSRPSLWGAGVVGGVVALVLGGGVYYAGFLPQISQNNSTGLQQIEAEIAGLKTALAQERSQNESLKTTLDQALSNINTKEDASGVNTEVLQSVEQKIATLQAGLDGLSAQSGDPEALRALNEKFVLLEQKLAQSDAANQKAEAALRAVEGNDQKINALAQAVEKLPEQFASPIQGRELALLTAANALKDAVNRGGSFSNEWQSFKDIAGDIESDKLAQLKTYAAEGLPNQAMLSASFAKVADAIAATVNRLPDNAGITERLWSDMKGLVSSRPVGNVEGSGADAVAARMEVAINTGDYQKALNEWQTLDENAKAVSRGFVEKMAARQTADGILSDIVSLALKPRDAAQQ